MGEYIIKVNNAFKKFKETTALNNVSIDFEKGKIHGIIGRNGSGKQFFLSAYVVLCLLRQEKLPLEKRK